MYLLINYYNFIKNELFEKISIYIFNTLIVCDKLFILKSVVVLEFGK
jgi:hypothetical protein